MKSNIDRINQLSKELTEELKNVIFDTPNNCIMLSLGLSMKDMEKIIIEKTLKHFENNQTKTASSLGIGRSTLWRLMTEHDIK